MNTTILVDYRLDFSNSKIISYKSEGIDLIIFLEACNSAVLKLQFADYILFFNLKAEYISDICEVPTSNLFELALKKEFKKVPLDHGYKLFQFFDLSNCSVIEVVCKELSIIKLSEPNKLSDHDSFGDYKIRNITKEFENILLSIIEE